MAKQWISSAIKKPGALTAQAKRAGKSLDEFCAQENLDTTTKRRCALRKTLMGFHKK